MRKIISIFLFLPLWASSQSAFRQSQAKVVFENLVQAYANGKSAPALEINPLKSNVSYIAQFTIVNDRPVIRIDEKLINLCYSLGPDSLSALSVIISHELAHYYNDHGWCSDYAFALSKSNIEFANRLKSATINGKIEKETFADRYGLFYAAVAGYNSFNIFNTILEKIYSLYGIPAIQPGYPSLIERKKIASDASKKASELYEYFKAGLKAFNDEKYLEAINAFETANSFIPCSENYNNSAVAKVRIALRYKPLTKEEFESPNRFLYPLETENSSRLNRNVIRSPQQDDYEKYISLLKSAQLDLQKALTINPGFSKARINLACVFDLFGKPAAAIGELSQIDSFYESNAASRIYAIALYHSGQYTASEEIWAKLGL